MVLLQGAIAAGLFFLNMVYILFIAGVVGSWIYFYYSDKKDQKEITITRYLLRFVKSVLVAITLIMLLILFLLIWNPPLE